MARTSRKAAAAQAAPEIREVVYDTALYVRLSVMDSGKADGESILNQQDLLERYVAERPEFTLKDAFVDNGETGVDFLRPAWNDLMSECRAGRINCIVVKDLSRVGRNYIETGEYLEKILPLLGVRLIAVNDGYDSISMTNGQQMLANLKNLINDIYAKDISRKSAAALRTKQKNGAFIGSYAAYGYQKVEDNKNIIVVDPETAPIVRQIYRWKAEGMGNAQICRNLNSAGIPSPNRYRLMKGIMKDERYRNVLWQVATVITILKNPVYLGHTAQGKHIGSVSDGIDRYRSKEEDWIIVEDTHELIIEKEVFDEVRALMDKRSAEFHAQKGKYAHFEKPELLLKGLLFCADCGKPLYRYKSVTGNGKHCDWIYLCRTSESLQACPQKYIYEPDVYGAVYRAIRLEIERCADVAAVIEKLNRENGYKKRLSRFDAEIEEAERELKRIASLRQAVYEDYAAKTLTASEYHFAVEKYGADTKRNQDRLDMALRDKAEFTQSSTPTNKWIAAFSRFMDSGELTAEMAQALVERVEVSNRNYVSVVFKFRDEYEAVSCFVGVA